MPSSYGDLFSGFGGATIGAMAAGYTPLWGVELRGDVAEVANANLGGHIRVLDILDANPRRFERVDHLHASPPCPNFSVAKAGAVETVLDIALARKVAEFVTVLQPETFTLENVYGYRHSRSWAIIEDTLHEVGYWVNVEYVNAANMGVPQTRKRMIVRAVRGGFVPYLPEPVEWIGWYAAIEDLLDTLPESQFAPWQLARLPETLADHFLITNGQGESLPGRNVSWANEPTNTIKANDSGKPWAFLMAVNGEASTVFPPASPTQAIVSANGIGKYRAFIVPDANDSCAVRLAAQPCYTQTISTVPGRAWLSAGRVVAMTPRTLARFQSFPDWYELPEKRSLAAYGIGNAVPPLMMQRILEGLYAD